MAGKRSGSYESIIRGVSQQIPEDRREGQHFEQVNFLSDTIEGLVRRAGSEVQDEVVFSAYNSGTEQATIADTASFKSFDFASDQKSNRYTIMYRSAQKVANSLAPFAFVIDRENFKFTPTVFGSDALFNQLSNGGASAIVNVGDFLYIAGNEITTNYTTQTPWDNKDNKSKGVVWVRSGNNNQKYSSTLIIRNIVDNSIITINAEYQTVSSQYPGVLDTSDISADDEAYQKKVNDRTNEYNNAANAWITSSSIDRQPSNIAQKLMESFIANSPSGLVSYQRSGSTVGIITQGDYVIEELTSDDGSDKTSIRAVGNQVSSAEFLSASHFPNKIVRLIPENGTNLNAKYMIATPESSFSNPNQLGDVNKWKETAGVITTPINCFAMGVINNGTFYLAGSKAELMSISGLSTDDVPDFVGSQVGDDITVRPPYFTGRKITYLGNFQDRLIIGSDAVLSFSRTGKYLDFFRETMSTISDDDGIEIFSLGSEGDTIVSSTFFDKNLIFFGNRKQYVLPGQNVLTPKTTTLTMLSSHEDAVDSDPKSSGNFIFYTQYRNNVTSLHQFQQGLVQDSPDSNKCSSQLSTYLNGQPIEIKPLTSPNKIVLRLRNNRNKLYFYDYLDDNGQRLFDSWSRWEWDKQLGSHVGLAYRKGNLGVCSIRHNGSNWFVACDNFVFDQVLTDKPIMDGLRKYSDLPDSDNTKFIAKDSTHQNMSISYDNNSPRFLLGQKWENKDNLLQAYPSENQHLWVGFACPAYVTPTNPYIRDNKDKAMINGRLTINKFTISVDKTSGIIVNLKTKYVPNEVILDSNVNKLGMNTIVGTQPILYNDKFNAYVGKETREFEWTINSNKWLPISIKGIEWTGQFFYNSGRA